MAVRHREEWQFKLKSNVRECWVTTTASVTIGIDSQSLWKSDWLNIIPKDIPCLMVLWLWWRVLCAAVRVPIGVSLSCFFTLLLYDIMLFKHTWTSFHNRLSLLWKYISQLNLRVHKNYFKSSLSTLDTKQSHLKVPLFAVPDHVTCSSAACRITDVQCPIFPNFFLDLGNSFSTQGSIVSFQP